MSLPQLSPLPISFHAPQEARQQLLRGKAIWGPKFIFIVGIFTMFPRYAKLYQLLGQVSNLQILGGPGVCKTELVTTLANMFGIRDLIVLASSSITSMRSRSNVGAGLPLLITDPRKPDKLGNLIDSDLLHSAYQIDANETKRTERV